VIGNVKEQIHGNIIRVGKKMGGVKQNLLLIMLEELNGEDQE
jgi:hypothetical protein